MYLRILHRIESRSRSMGRKRHTAEQIIAKLRESERYQTWGTSCLKVSCLGVPGFFFLRFAASGGFQSIFS